MTLRRPTRSLLSVVLRDGLLVAVGLGALAFLLASGIRRLNFDESLALRSGWLVTESLPSEPPFYMPFTLALGGATQAIDDPGRLFPVARSIAAIAVLVTLGWALVRAQLGTVRGITAAGLCLLQASFAVHAYELRYDWSILVGWIVTFALLQRRNRMEAVGLGMCVAWLAAHHLKGVFYAAFAHLFAVSAILADGRGRRGRLIALHLALAVSAASWVAMSLVVGNGSDLVGVYASFAELATAPEKTWPWEALEQSFSGDAVWWLLAGGGLVGASVHAWRLRTRSLREACEDPELWALFFATVPLLFLFAHPHPWPYMLVPCAPFLSILVVTGAGRLATSRRIAVIATSAAIALVTGYGGVTGIWPGAPYKASLLAPNGNQVATLRMLRRITRPDEPIIDPSGLAYFRPPCTSQWYLDSLFAVQAARGTWMADLAERSPAECPWVLNTYRLQMLPERIRTQLRRDYAMVAGGIAVARETPYLVEREGWEPLPHTELYSFWW